MLCVIPIYFSVPIRKGKLTQPAGQYDLPHTGRKILFHGLLLRQVAHPLLRVRQMETDLTCRLFFEPQDPFDKSAFTGAIFSDDAQIAPFF